MLSLPVIAVTLGDPAGIGPEIALRAAWKLRHEIHAILIGDWHLLENLAQNMTEKMSLRRITKDHLSGLRSLCHAETLLIIDCPLMQVVVPGHPDPANATAILAGLDIAIQGTVAKHFDAMATAPIQKSTINAAGIAFTGHTEYLAESLQTDNVVMLLAGHVASSASPQSQTLRVALATTHLPLKAVPAAITQASLIQVLQILHKELENKFGISGPHILVSGLNPHAGENGYLGMEETEIITPVIHTLQRQGMNIEGPFPADTLFLPHHLEQADCFLTMYHDQGLPVLKHATFGRGVNVTLGLPIIRTSVDHGTALDIAKQGTGLADDGSMIEAIRLAADMVLRVTHC